MESMGVSLSFTNGSKPTLLKTCCINPDALIEWFWYLSFWKFEQQGRQTCLPWLAKEK
jgi:hypothetical protein